MHGIHKSIPGKLRIHLPVAGRFKNLHGPVKAFHVILPFGIPIPITALQPVFHIAQAAQDKVSGLRILQFFVLLQVGSPQPEAFSHLVLKYPLAAVPDIQVKQGDSLII